MAGKVDTGGLLASLGINLTGLETQAYNFLLKQAAAWARVPTRFRRLQSAITIVSGAATQKGNVGVATQMKAAQAALAQLESAYDNASGDVADVVDVVRGLEPGQAPPVTLIPKAAKTAAVVGAILKGLTGLEQQVMGNARAVLSTVQLAQLSIGMSFPLHMAVQGGKFLLYALLAVPLYLVLAKKRRR